MGKVLFRGPCDIRAISQYFKKTDKIVIESAFKGKFLETVWDASISLYLMHSATQRMLVDNKFVDPAFYPSSKIYEENEFDAIIISCIGDGILGLYENIVDGTKLAYGIWTSDATKNDGEEFFDDNITHGGIPSLTRQDYHEFSSKYKYLGRISAKDCALNYEEFIKRVPRSTKIIILLGPTFNSDYGEKNPALLNDGKEFYAELNKSLILHLSQYHNVSFIDPKDYYKKPKNKYDIYYYNYPTMNHYPCITYFKMAKRIKSILSKKTIKLDYKFYLKQKLKRKKKIIVDKLHNIFHK